MRQADEVIESWQLIYGFPYTVSHCECLSNIKLFILFFNVFLIIYVALYILLLYLSSIHASIYKLRLFNFLARFWPILRNFV